MQQIFANTEPHCPDPTGPSSFTQTRARFWETKRRLNAARDMLVIEVEKVIEEAVRAENPVWPLKISEMAGMTPEAKFAGVVQDAAAKVAKLYAHMGWEVEHKNGYIHLTLPAS